MAGDRFQDRFEEATYAADHVVEVFEQSPDERDAMCLSERLFHRLVGVARAYELPAMSLLQFPDMMCLVIGSVEARN